MTRYNLKTLKALNERYDYEYGVTEQDVERVNAVISIIEESRNTTIPQLGDAVQYTSKSGNYYSFAHIDAVEKDELYICESPYIPFVSINRSGTTVSFSTSGGAWTYIPQNIEFVRTDAKVFKIWGEGGARANGAVQFIANVSVWKYTDGEHEFTTATHDKYLVQVRDGKTSDSAYKYVISKASTLNVNFYTEEEYQAWLKTYNGVEMDGIMKNTKIVWTYKQTTSFIPLEEYLSIENAIVDTELCNGVIQECKRIIEDTKIHTFLPYQSNKIVLPGEKCYKKSYE